MSLHLCVCQSQIFDKEDDDAYTQKYSGQKNNVFSGKLTEVPAFFAYFYYQHSASHSLKSFQ